jgi:succinyl-diaminopimelate desuccinylase
MAARAAAEVLGRESKTAGASYFTDASVLKRAYGGAPTIILGPGLPEQAHQPNEYCPAANVELCADIFERLARAWCIPSSA